MKPSPGFTLIELCMAIAITLTLSTLGLFAFKDYQEFQKTTYIVSALKQTLYYARLQAVFRQRKIDIEAINHQWQQGWIIRDNTKLLKKYPQMPLPITSNNNENPNIVIYPDGMAYLTARTMTINNKTQCIINSGGRINIEK